MDGQRLINESKTLTSINGHFGALCRHEILCVRRKILNEDQRFLYAAIFTVKITEVYLWKKLYFELLQQPKNPCVSMFEICTRVHPFF